MTIGLYDISPNPQGCHNIRRALYLIFLVGDCLCLHSFFLDPVNSHRFGPAEHESSSCWGCGVYLLYLYIQNCKKEYQIAKPFPTG